MRAILTGLTTLTLATSSALATTTAPTTPAPGATPGAGAPGAGAAGGIGDYWWLIIVVVLVALARGDQVARVRVAVQRLNVAAWCLQERAQPLGRGAQKAYVRFVQDATGAIERLQPARNVVGPEHRQLALVRPQGVVQIDQHCRTVGGGRDPV